MAKTANYDLYLTESSSETFLSWRDKMNGKEDSNMVKIDTILGGKADSSKVVNTTLVVSEWSENGSHYEQILPVEGLLADTNGIINIAQGASDEVRDVVRKAMLVITEQVDGALMVVADGSVPRIDIPVSIIIVN